MKNLLFIVLFVATFSLVGIPAVSYAATITCYTNCSPSYANVVGVFTLNPQCNASSPTSYTVSLTVNGASVSGTKNCAPPPVNGSCTPNHYVCGSGVLGATAEYPSEYHWWCNGTGGGANRLCVEYKAPCSYTGTVPWGSCSASGTWNALSGGSVTVYNTATGYTGSATYSCSNGAWSGPTSQSCSAVAAPVPTPPPVNGSWTAPACITTCGTSYSQPYSCTGGNGVCLGSQPSTKWCPRTACATTTPAPAPTPTPPPPPTPPVYTESTSYSTSGGNLTLTVSSAIVNAGTNSTLTYTRNVPMECETITSTNPAVPPRTSCSQISYSCNLSGPGLPSRSITSDSSVSVQINAESIFTFRCSYGTATARVRIRPTYTEQ